MELYLNYQQNLVPEPGSMMLLGTGAITLWGVGSEKFRNLLSKIGFNVI